MNKTISSIALFALCLGLLALPARADDAGGEQLAVKGSLAAGVQGVGETARSSKFSEYRDVPRGAFLKALNLDLSKGNRYFYFSVMNAQQADQRFRADAGTYGLFKLELGYDKTPHRFSFFGATPYVETAPGVFGLNDVVRSAAENLVPTGTNKNLAEAQNLISRYLASAAPLDLGLQRKKATLDFSFTPTVPLAINVSGVYEKREGNRPFGAPLAFSAAIELPEPIRYTTTNLDTTIEFHQKWGTMRAGFAASIFENEVQTLVWDNPYRTTDSTYSGAYSSGNGTSRGRMALWPSNNALRFYLSGSFKPLPSTRISAAATYSLFNQNEKLQPFTLNTAIPPSDPYAARALEAPRESAEAKANITSLDFRLSSRLLKSVHLTAGFRYYDFANKIKELDMPEGYSRLDQVWEDIPIAVEPYSFSRSQLYADLSVSVLANTSLKAGYALYGVRRHEGTHETEKNKTDEGVFKVTVDSQLSDWLNLRVGYLNSKRDWSLGDTWYAYVPGFNFKRYYEADRDRQAVNALVGLSLVKNLDVQLTYGLGRDDYSKSDYGLLRDDFDMYGIDLSYALSKRHSVYAFYARELYDADQASRQSGSSFSLNPADDWTANLKDTVDTTGAGWTCELLENKLALDLSGTYSRAAGSSFLDSPAGGSPNVAANFTKPLDTTTWWTVRSSFSWKMAANLTVVLGYFYDQYEFDDIARTGVVVDYVKYGAIYLGATEPGYKYHGGFMNFIFTW